MHADDDTMLPPELRRLPPLLPITPLLRFRDD